MPHSAGSPAPRMMRRWCVLLTTTLVASVTTIAVPGAASAADLNATPSNLSSVYASAQGGDVIHLAAGSYGSFSGGSKSSVVTLTPQSGAAATISPNLGSGVNNLRFDGVTVSDLYTNGAHNTAFVNVRFTGPARVDTPANVSNANVVFDRVTFDGIDACGSCYEGRLTVRGYDNGSPVGVRVTNSHFGNGGCSDGVQIIGDAYGVEVGPGNEFSGIRQSGCQAHVDSIQLYGSSHTQIVGNYFHDNDTIIMAPDGGDAENIADNVMVGAGYVPAVQLGSHRGTRFVHNTVRSIDVHMDHKSGEAASANGVVGDNVFVGGATNALDSGNCSGCTVSYNLFNSGGDASGSNAQVATPTFTGGPNPGSYGGYALASGSPGKANASDGADRGARISGGSTPPPDTTAPDTTITSGPTGTTNDSTPTFAFTATEANPVYECRVDSGSWVDCASPWTTSALSDGAHSVSVRATDVAGNTDASPATRSFTVDTAPPPDTTAPDTTITSGPSSTTNDSTPTFAFSSTEANSVFECRVDSGAWANCASPWTTSALGDGAHTVAVRATDVAGNTDATPATRSFTVDTMPPADTTPPDTTISSGPTGTVTSTSASFAFTASESGSTFECKLDAGAYAACTSPKAYAGLSDGSHTFSVRATDAAGNVDASPAARSWTVQSPPADHQPAAAYTYSPSSPTAGQAVSYDASSATCQDTPCTYTWEDDGTDGSGGTQWPLGSGKTMSFTFQDPGVKNVRVTVADADGDTNSTMKAVTVAPASPPADTTAPDTTIGSGPNSATNDSTPTFAFTASESGSTFLCRVDSGSWAGCTSPWTTSALSDGAHSVSVRATDAAGNTDATPASRTFTVDTQAPSTTIASAPPALSPGSSATVAFSSNESGATFECQLDGGAWAGCTSPKTYTGLTLGGHTVKVRATDAAGNADATPDSASWTSIALPGSPAAAPAGRGTTGSANQAPAVALAAPAAGSTFTSTLRMAATASDDHGVQRVEFWVDGTRVARDGAAPSAAMFTAGRSTSYGVHTVTVRAFDAAGRARSAAVTVNRVRAATTASRPATKSSTGRARAASASSDARQNMLVAVSMWRLSSWPADGAGTLLRGRGMPGRSATVSLTRCADTSGAIAVVIQLNAGADGTLYARQAADGLCVLRVRPFGDS
jgi:hypothetical protein